MRKILLGIALLSATALAGLWALVGFEQLAEWATNEQRNFQNQMAASLRALRSGQPGATAILLGVCFAYGFIHAVGPGHGKLLIGGYGVATSVTVKRLSIIAVLSSLAQGTSAVILVYLGIMLLNLTRVQLVDSAEDIFAPVSHAAIALVGVWLIIRGVRKYRKTMDIYPYTQTHDDTGHSNICESCGHRHGPSIKEVENVQSLSDLIVLVVAIAIRPCTGALFLLILTWRFDVFAAGIAGTFAMSLGTASVTIAIAIAATLFRTTTLWGMSDTKALRIIPTIEIAIGFIISFVAIQLLIAIY